MADITTTIDIWLTRMSAVPRALLPEYYALMDQQESARNSRYRYQSSRDADAITRALQRTVLSHYTGMPPGQWRFAAAEGGKPHISSPASELHFNLSHTADWVVCAVADFPCVGIDIEHCERKVHASRMAEHFFSREECDALEHLSHDLQKSRFFDYWTLKEAYMKARGEGIALGFEKFRFVLDADRQIGFSCDPQLDDNASDWAFRLSADTADHRLALAAKPPEPNSALRIRQFETVPLYTIEAYTGLLSL